MAEKSLYAHILNLSAPWQVSSLSLGKNSGSMTVTVGIAEQTPLICPTWVKTCPIHDTYAVNGVTSIPSSSLHWLKLMFRIDCPENDCQTLLVPRSGPGTRYTLQFEFFVL
ncbi:hypothetical protein ERD95_03140 [Enterobacteriaceae bacterium ML5]|nr:hypothetical protein ERD95_03140 [Enterobacteriaceae bacterium ML5]